MRRLLYLLPLALFFLHAAPARATITLVHATPFTCTSPCTQTIAATGAGHALVIMASGGASITSLTCTSTCGTWVHNANCLGTDATAGDMDCEYVASATAGATSFTVTQTNNDSVFFFELSTTLTPFVINTGATAVSNRDQSTAATSIAGVALTLSAVNAFVIQGIHCGGNCTAVTTYAGIFDATNGNGAASLINTTSGTAPTWTSTSGRAAMSAVSLQETPAVTHNMPPVVF